MFKIGIDARLYSQTGIGIYLQNLLFYLSNYTDRKWKIFIFIKDKKQTLLIPPSKNYEIRIAPFHWHTIDEQISFLVRLHNETLDLMHFTYFSYPVLYKKKFISTIHDVTPLYFKTGRASTKNPFIYELKHLAFKLVISEQVKNARAIITPSATLSISSAFSPESTSPFPMTGMFTCSLTCLMIFQFALPEYPCACVLP